MKTPDPDRHLPDPGHECTTCHTCGQREQEDPADLDCTECAECRDERERRVANERSEAEEAAECERCGTLDGVKFAPCPYASEIHGYDTPVWLCDLCRDERAAEADI